jgi:hypothetical protein
VQKLFEVGRILSKFLHQCRTFEKLKIALPRAENAENKIEEFFPIHRNFGVIYQIHM